MAMEAREFATKEELWRIQETINDLSATQATHSERIMRLEQKTPEGSRSRSLWGSNSPFPLGSSHHGESEAVWVRDTELTQTRIDAKSGRRSLSQF
jgi:hypothetical protein